MAATRRRVRFIFEIDNCSANDQELAAWLKEQHDDFERNLAQGEIIAVNTMEVVQVYNTEVRKT